MGFPIQIERPAMPVPRLGEIRSDCGATYIAHGFIGWLFAATGPVAIILAVGGQGGLTETQLASWVFGVFLINGVITALLSWVYRMPMAFFWTIPGTVLIGPALKILSFPEVIGAFYATGALILLLGVTGWVKKLMNAIPMPIVMGMVAGVFLRFGTDLVHAVRGDFAIAGPMVLVWLLLSTFRRVGEKLPPIIGALLVGAAASLISGQFHLVAGSGGVLAHPVFTAPDWSWSAMIDLVIPLAITVLAVQNGQGIAVLKTAGHEAPIDATTFACGVGSLLAAMVGGASTCLAGPTNAILTSSGVRQRHYIAGLTTGLLSVVFGLFASGFTRLMLSAPAPFISTLAGLAMLRVLQSAFVSTFQGKYAMGGLISFLVTVSNISLFNIGAAFWGLLAGYCFSRLLEGADFKAPS